MIDIYDEIQKSQCHICKDGGELEYHGDEDGFVWCIICGTGGPTAHCATKKQAAKIAFRKYTKMQRDAMNLTSRLNLDANVSSQEVLIIDAITDALKFAQINQSVDISGAQLNLAPMVREYAEFLEAGIWPPRVLK